MRKVIKVNASISLTELKYRYAHDINDGMQDDSIHENTLTIPNPYSLQNALDFIQLIKDFESKHQVPKDWAIVKEGKMIGGIGLLYDFGVSAHLTEIGYWLHRDFRGNGMMTVVLKALSDFVFNETSHTKLLASVFEHNIASSKALLNAGFEKEGIMNHHYLKNGSFLIHTPLRTSQIKA